MGDSKKTTIPNDIRLLSLHSLRQLSEVTPFTTAILYYQSNNVVCAVLCSDVHEILIARKEGDTPRTWKSVERAIGFLRARFPLQTLTLKFQRLGD